MRCRAVVGGIVWVAVVALVAGPVLAGSGDGGVLVADQATGALYSVGADGDLEALPREAPVELAAPRGIALSPDGTTVAIVAAGGGDGEGSIVLVTADGQVSIPYSGLTYPEAIVWLDDSTFAWTSSVEGVIRRGDPGGSEPDVITDVGGMAIGIGLIQQGVGTRLLVTTWQGTSFVVDPGTGTATPTGDLLEGGGHPAISSDMVCVPEYFADRVRCRSVGGAEHEVAVTDPVAAAFDGDDLLVTSPAGLSRFDPDGQLVDVVQGLVNAAGVAPLGAFGPLWAPPAVPTTTTSTVGTVPPAAVEETTTTTAAAPGVSQPAGQQEDGGLGGLALALIALVGLAGILLGFWFGRRRQPGPAVLPLSVRRAMKAAAGCDEEEFWRAFWVAESELAEFERRIEWAETMGEDPAPIRRALDAATEALERARRELLERCPRPQERFVDFGGESVDPIPEPCRALAEMEQELQRIVDGGGEPDPALVETARRLADECEQAKRPKATVTGTATVGAPAGRYFIHVYVDSVYTISHVAVGLTGPGYDKVWSTGERDTESKTDSNNPDTIRHAFFEPGSRVEIDGVEVEFGTQEWYRLLSKHKNVMIIGTTIEVTREEFEEARRRLVGWLMTDPGEWFARQGWIYVPILSQAWGGFMNKVGWGEVLGPFDHGEHDQGEWIPVPSTAAMCPSVWLAVRSIFTDSSSWGVSWLGGHTVLQDVTGIAEDRAARGKP